ncbi:D-glycero-beta-D-manno-heptose 1,7-bisphosphate 7-phosphatase [Fangia hongkongensis]|uniref:D-glycero-beta-D-manno-heptose 1,7-bisphosphate 7-phosphatase n=1 Tax=Fangia hongkongensis TaxID=270495 RepID=UPI00035E197D|nr:D-glycero-beta-D-manno-heptose 1,7-bisphosphate 7-phosphatase [Fangia hongkongensis]MBK2123691.1 D-glycero-beta-D-manno-heptose 1,7-bisphosphate 7-phosphatase [Fangia hongkongensis]
MTQITSQPSLVILDRDGVINEDSDQYIKTADEWQPIPGSINAIGRLKAKKIPLAVATNQSGIARGYFSYGTLTEMHNKLFSLLGDAKDAIYYIAICPHGPDDDCRCRKPKIGLCEEISQKLSIPLSQSVYFVGDSLKDIEAAIAANCTPVLVKTGKGVRTLATKSALLDDCLIFDNLEKFVDYLQ